MKTFCSGARKRLGPLAMAAWMLGACNGTPSARAEQERNRGPAAEPRPDVAHVAPERPQPANAPTRKHDVKEGYPWFDGTNQTIPLPVATLEERFPTSAGFTRVKLDSRSFGSFLRNLPLAAPNTPVLSYRGDVIREGNHPHVAAVVAIDVGNRDLQQCADAVMRLHAEWRYARGDRNQAYRAADGTNLTFARYAAGSRLHFDGKKLSFVQSEKRAETTHALMREWLDEVFGWANTGSLARDGKKIKYDDLRPGDFFVVTGVPFGHTVLVLDMAKDAQGRKALLLGQSFVPAQNFHVLRPNPASAWFVVNEEEGAVDTPFWDPFPFDSIRRLPE